MMHYTTAITSPSAAANGEQPQSPLSDVTAVWKSQSNVLRQRKPDLRISALNEVNQDANSFPSTPTGGKCHNPYSPVLPSTPAEMVRVQREREIKEYMRTYVRCTTPATPNLSAFYSGSFPATPTLTPTNSFCRNPSPVQFFEEPALGGRSPSPAQDRCPSPIQCGVAASVMQPAPQRSQNGAPVLKKVYENGRPVARVADDTVQSFVESTTPAVTALSPATVASITPEASKYVRVALSTGESVFRLKERVSVGQHVIVDGDRGIDLGRVVGTAADGTESIGDVQRLATNEEVDSVAQLRADEAAALEYVQQQALRLLGPKFHALRVAFQFDREKLTVWYRSPERVYFVPLNKTLNQQYKCRIWMVREGESDDCNGAA